MSRPNELGVVNPNNEVTSGPFPPVSYFYFLPIGPMTADEIAFWTARVKTYSVAGSVTCDGKTASISFVGSGDNDELSRWTTGNVVGIDGGTGIISGVGLQANTVSSGIPPFFAHDPSDLTGLFGWSMLLNFEMQVFVYDDVGGGVIEEVASNNLFLYNFGSQVVSSFTLTLQGTDLVRGHTYSRALTVYETPDSGGVLGDQKPVTGAIIISPDSFFPYANSSGTPLYDTATGALL